MPRDGGGQAGISASNGSLSLIDATIQNTYVNCFGAAIDVEPTSVRFDQIAD